MASVGKNVARPSFESVWRWVNAIHFTGLFFVVFAISARSAFASAALEPVSTRNTPSPASSHEQSVPPKTPYQRPTSLKGCATTGAAAAGAFAAGAGWAAAGKAETASAAAKRRETT